MAIYVTPKAKELLRSNTGLKQALISDPASDATDVASTCASIIDVLQTYGMVA